MGKKAKNITSFIILPFLILLTVISMSAAVDVPTITKEELKARLDSSKEPGLSFGDGMGFSAPLSC